LATIHVCSSSVSDSIEIHKTTPRYYVHYFSFLHS
jgi:hypothetical protein